MPDPADPTPKPRGVVCEFCECKLTAKGEVLQMSATAKEMRKLQDRVEALGEKLTERDGEVARLTSELAEARAAVKTDEGGSGRGLFG
jgi:predicted RNase H-like nuclease (RuvC/YqgF family)